MTQFVYFQVPREPQKSTTIDLLKRGLLKKVEVSKVTIPMTMAVVLLMKKTEVQLPKVTIPMTMAAVLITTPQAPVMLPQAAMDTKIVRTAMPDTTIGNLKWSLEATQHTVTILLTITTLDMAMILVVM